MPHFIFAYHGGRRPDNPAAAAKMMEQWKIWLDGLGDAAVQRGNPVGQSFTVTSGGVEHDGGANPLSGYSIVQAESVEAALDLAEGCPHLHHGTIEVAEIIPM